MDFPASGKRKVKRVFQKQYEDGTLRFALEHYMKLFLAVE
jgi:hypothetical protein